MFIRFPGVWPTLSRHLRALGALQVHWGWMDKAKAHLGHLLCHHPLAALALPGAGGISGAHKSQQSLDRM